MNASVISLAEEMQTCTPVKPVVAKTKTRRVFEEDTTPLRHQLVELRNKRSAIIARRDNIRQSMQAKLDEAQQEIDAIDSKITVAQMGITRKMRDEDVFLRRTKGRTWRNPFFIGLVVFPLAMLMVRLVF